MRNTAHASRAGGSSPLAGGRRSASPLRSVRVDPAFASLQRRLPEVLALSRPGGRVDHVWVALPSFSIAEAILLRYCDLLPAFEHRYLVACLALRNLPSAELVFICSRAPEPAVLDHYFGLIPPAQRDDARKRFRLFVVDDGRPLPVATKLLDRPDLVAALRASFAGRPAFIDPWNVTSAEVGLALALDAPLHGADPALWPLGFKSAGRRLFAAVGVPHPAGVEDVRSVTDAVSAVAALRRARPSVGGVVVKHDDSGHGDGNAVIDLAGLPTDQMAESAALRACLEALPAPYLEDLRKGAVVEELMTAEHVASPSVQVTIGPDGEVAVYSTHEQILGGEHGQSYTGCRFPARPEYAGELARHGGAVGRELGRAGVVGRFGLDFVATRASGGPWSLWALEVNLRKGGTAHPFGALRHLVPGAYDTASGEYRSEAGPAKHYYATDNLVDPAWLGLPEARAVAAVDRAGLTFDPVRGTGVVLHMLSGLAVDGRFGLTAIADSEAAADELAEATRMAVDRETGRT